MSNEITQSNNAPNLPAEVSTEIRLLMTSPADYLKNLPIERIDAERPPNAVMLSQMKRGLDRMRQMLYIEMLIVEVNDFFNVRGNMNEKQIELTAELILDNPGFYDLTLGNIKACFRHKMMTAKLYDRLDGNIIIDWLREFKSDMADHCETLREGYARKKEREEQEGDVGVITHAAYMAMLEARANDGDKEAMQVLNEYKKRSRILSKEEQHKKELEFFKYRQQYAKQHQELHPQPRNRGGESRDAKELHPHRPFRT